MGLICDASQEEADYYRVPYQADCYRFYKWVHGPKTVLFSACLRGDVLEMHLATKNATRLLYVAVDDFCRAMFDNYSITKIAGFVGTNGLIKLAKRCGFSVVAKVDGLTIVELDR